jgi:hypothetical protein
MACQRKLLTGLRLIVGLVLLAGCRAPENRIRLPPSLAVSLPFDSHGRRAAYLDCQPPLPFHVLLTNNGSSPVRLWEEWCSWGYYSVQLEIVGPDGQKHLLKKRRTAFYGNFPAAFELQPGEAVAWDIELSSHTWNDLSWAPREKEVPGMIRATFIIEPTEESVEFQVWTGRVQSPWYNLTMLSDKKDSDE